MAKKDSDKETTGGTQSLDLALGVLMRLARMPGPVGVSDLARACGMPASKTHRYLTSFTHAGLVSQSGRSGKYDLGPQAIRLGLAALNRHDFVNETADGMAQLVETTGMTGMISVWGDHGPTVVRWHRAASLVVASLGLGTTLPLLTSATGRVFLACLPQAVTGELLEQELKSAAASRAMLPDIDVTKESVAAMAERVRLAGYATVDGRYIPGLVAASAPVLDWQGEAQVVVTLIGTRADQISENSDAIAALLAFCRQHSLA